MNNFYIGLCSLAAYLLGSIPTAIWYGEAYFGIDIRQHGSGNAGATNTLRVLGKKAGTTVILIDVLKGWVATSLASGLFILQVIDANELVIWKLTFGIFAVLGHVFPFWAKFKGGKGVATLLGMTFAVHSEAALICLGVFLLIFFITHFVSLGSMLAAISFPVMMLMKVFGQEHLGTIIFGLTMSVLVIVTHRKNIKRLLSGTETKIFLFKSKKALAE
jgi:acyl phosphate:glycerol-3-phosphate acyltransferase